MTLKQLRVEMRERAEKATPGPLFAYKGGLYRRQAQYHDDLGAGFIYTEPVLWTHPIDGVNELNFYQMASPDNILALLKATDSAEHTLSNVRACIGDRLLARGPLSKEYAFKTLAEIDAALAEIGAGE